MVLRSQLKHPNKQLQVYCLIQFPQLMLLPLQSCIYVSQHVITSLCITQTLVLQNGASRYGVPHGALHREWLTTRRKQKHTGYARIGFNFHIDRFGEVASKNVFSAADGCHREGIVGHLVNGLH